MNVVRRRPADDRMLFVFFGVSLVLHLVVFVAGRLSGGGEQRVMPVYNVKLVTTVPGGGRRAEAPTAKGSPEGKAAEAPAAKEPAPAPTPAKAEPAPAPKPVAKAAPAKKETKPSVKAEKKKAPETKSAKASDDAAGKAATKAKAKTEGAGDAKTADLGSALAAVKGLIKDKQRGSENGMEGGTRTEVGEFGAGQGGAQAGALALQIYAGQVQNAIQRNWRIPGELARLSIVVQLGLRIGADGVVQDVWVDKGSGVAIFDESAMRAVRAASPLPVPPQTKNGYFELYTRFTPQGARSN